MEETETLTDTEQMKEKTFRINFRVILRILLGIVAVVAVVLLALFAFSKFQIWRRRVSIDRNNRSPYKTIKASKKWKKRRRRRRR